MTNLQDRLEFIENPESRIACIMIIDVSSSMSGEPIREVNRGIIEFGQQIESDELTSMRADVAIIAFNQHHEVVRDFSQHVDFSDAALRAEGGTKMAPPINTALDMIERRKEQYLENGIPYYRPIIMLLTDGKPEHDSPEELEAVSQRLKQAERERHVKFFAIGTESADMKALSSLSSEPPATLRGTNFVALFQWLSNSITIISQSQIGEGADLPSTDHWSRY